MLFIETITILFMLFTSLLFAISVNTNDSANDSANSADSSINNMQDVKIINLTPHEINLHLGDNIISFPPSGTIARAGQKSETVGSIRIEGCEVFIKRNTFGALEGAPDPQPNTLFIVSALAANAAPEREDFLVPGDPVRDEQGKIIGCRSFCRI